MSAKVLTKAAAKEMKLHSLLGILVSDHMKRSYKVDPYF